MSAHGYMYLARVVPIRGPVVVRARGQEPLLQEFNFASFPLARARPENVPILIDHRDEHKIGRLAQMTELDGWLAAVFFTEPGIERFERGTPISAGFRESHVTHKPDGARFHQLAELDEISVVAKAAIPGAMIVQRYDYPAPTRRIVQRAFSAAAGDVELRLPPGAVIRRPCGVVLGVR